MSKAFDGLDIENMFAEAANASENTGEKDPAMYGKNPKKEIAKETNKQENKSEVSSKPVDKKPAQESNESIKVEKKN